MRLKLIPDWRKALTFYSVQAALIGGGVLSGIWVVQLFGVSVPDYWVHIASGLTITSFIALRLVAQNKSVSPDLPKPSDIEDGQ